MTDPRLEAANLSAGYGEKQILKGLDLLFLPAR